MKAPSSLESAIYAAAFVVLVEVHGQDEDVAIARAEQIVQLHRKARARRDGKKRRSQATSRGGRR